MKRKTTSLCWLLATVFVLGCGFWYRQAWPLERLSVWQTQATYGQEVALAEAFSQQLYEESLIDINTAAKEELMELPYVGESIAEAIVAYRSENGPFQSPQELMEVKGIGEKTFAAMEERVKVTNPTQQGGND